MFRHQNQVSLFGNYSQFGGFNSTFNPTLNSTNGKTAKTDNFTDFYNKFLQKYENNSKLKNDGQDSNDNYNKNNNEDEFKTDYGEEYTNGYSGDVVNAGESGIFDKEDSEMLLEDGTVAPFNAIIEDGKIVGYESFGDE